MGLKPHIHRPSKIRNEFWSTFLCQIHEHSSNKTPDFQKFAPPPKKKTSGGKTSRMARISAPRKVQNSRGVLDVMKIFREKSVYEGV